MVLTNRLIPSAPTEVKRLSVLAGNGPSWRIDKLTSTPVGTLLKINLPHFYWSTLNNASFSLKSSTAAIKVGLEEITKVFYESVVNEKHIDDD